MIRTVILCVLVPFTCSKVAVKSLSEEGCNFKSAFVFTILAYTLHITINHSSAILQTLIINFKMAVLHAYHSMVVWIHRQSVLVPLHSFACNASRCCYYIRRLVFPALSGYLQLLR